MFSFLLQKFAGRHHRKYVEKCRPIVARINEFEQSYQALTDEQLRAKTVEFRARVAQGEKLDAILPEAFAAVKNAARRMVGREVIVCDHQLTWDMVHFDVQLIGGITLHEGRIAEMATGEGKTLVATLPLYLNALTAKNTQLVTVNDYLARRDSEWMGHLYSFLGLTVGCIQQQMHSEVRREMYGRDITYGTASEFGFDYLRDNGMATRKEDQVQRDHWFCIVDEIDSILVDEARTPLIISGPAPIEREQPFTRLKPGVEGLVSAQLRFINRLVKEAADLLEKPTVTADERHTAAMKMLQVKLGMPKNKQLLRLQENPEWRKLLDKTDVEMHSDFNKEELYIHAVSQLLKAYCLYERDVHYVVQDNKVIIVDEHTGRKMTGRRWSDGLHQAVEAKEGVEIERETQTYATITIQNYFRLYEKLAGMTGTAETEAQEFHDIYKLGVLTIPTNKPCIRVDKNDTSTRPAARSGNAVVRGDQEGPQPGPPHARRHRFRRGQRDLSRLLKKAGIVHTVLNAKYHQQEAEIVGRAGHRGASPSPPTWPAAAPTSSSAKASPNSAACIVIGTERHESRRIDRQLRGRCARQGDPGSSHFFLSLEDDLMRLFLQGNLASKIMEGAMKEGEELEHPWLNRSIESAQKKVEQQNFSIRKRLLQYDDVLNKQREVIYGIRNGALHSERPKDIIFEMIEDEVASRLESAGFDEKGGAGTANVESLVGWLNAHFPVSAKVDEFSGRRDFDALVKELVERIRQAYALKESVEDQSALGGLERYIVINAIDHHWQEHLTEMEELRRSIGLRSYGQKDPLSEYKGEAFRFFEELMNNVRLQICTSLFRSATNRDAFENLFAILSRSARLQGPAAAPTALAAATQAAAPAGEDAAPAAPAEEIKLPSVTIRREAPKVGRNDPCPCGSGKKFKNCHGAS
jgi:preprotein translocase subunit SecA